MRSSQLAASAPTPTRADAEHKRSTCPKTASWSSLRGRSAKPQPVHNHSHVRGEGRKRRNHWPFGELTGQASLTIVPATEIVRLRLERARFRVANGSAGHLGGTHEIIEKLGDRGGFAGVASVVSFAAMAKDLTVGVSWSNFQEERWKTDEAAIKAALEAAGDKYISADAQSSPQKQLDRHREPDRAGRQGADRARAGLRRDPARPSRRRSTKASRSSAMTA